MYGEKDSAKLSSSLLEVQKKLEGLRAKCISDPGNAEEILFDAQEQLHAAIKTLSAANKECIQQNEELLDAQEAPCEGEVRFRELAELLPDIIYEVNDNLKITYANRAAFKAFGYTKEDLARGIWIDEVIDPVQIEEAYKALATIDPEKPVQPHIYRVRRKDASTFLCEVSSTAIRDHDGHLIGFRGVMHDITERKRAENRLKLQRDLGIALSSISDINKALGLILNAALQVDGVDCGGIYLVDESTGDMELTVYSGLSQSSVEFCSHYPAESSHARFLSKTRPFFGLHREVAERLDEAKLEGLKGVAVLPVDYKGKIIACFNLASHSGSIPTESENALESLAAQIGGVIARIKAEEALRESRDYLNKIINSISDPIFVKDRQHRLILVNDASCRLFGRSRDEIIGLTAYDLFPSNEMADISWEKDEEVFRIGKENANEETNTYAPGVTRNVLVKKIPYTDDLGNQFLVGVTRDITDYKKAQEQVRFQADLLDQVHNVVIATDLDGNIIYWNKFAESLLQWTAEEILGRNIAETVVAEDKLDRMKSVISGLITSNSCNGEFNLRKKNGSIVPTYQSFSTIKDYLGNIVGLVGVAVDITERKRAEEALNNAKEDAEAAAKAKSEFLATMSHEIRTPLNAILGMTSLLLNLDLPAEHKESIETIKSSGDILLTTINDILDFSKIESGKTKLECQPFDLCQCIEESMDLVAAKAVEKGLDLVYLVDDPVPKIIESDSTMLRQVLTNLLSNAVKFTEQGKIEIFVKAQQLDRDHYELCFSVIDTGIGISKASLNKLFKPFSQVDMSTTRRYGGTGLGLVISKKLVEFMGGKIWAESEPGKGSTFYFTLKCHAAQGEHASLTETPPRPKISYLSVDGDKSLQILLAEDNPINQKVAIRILAKLGYKADAAANGLEVLQALERQPYDVILMDIQMPEMDGFEATKEIRKRWLNGPKIIAITAYALEGDKEKCLEIGMDDYISKPMDINKLAKALSKCHKEPSK